MNVTKTAFKTLLENNKTSGNTEWQSLKMNKTPMVEVQNLYLVFKNKGDLDGLTPDLPWAENHFQERISGIPSNPGKEYLNWPYYRNSDNDEKFRKTGKFSHTYQERIWEKKGNLNDVIDRLKENTYTRQAVLAIWQREDQENRNVRVPCTLNYHFQRENDLLNVTYHIRSCDAIRHFQNDIYMAYRLLEHVSESIGLKPGKLIMVIGNFHCFKSDLYTLNKLVNK